MKFTITLPGSIRSKKNSKRIYARGKFKTVLPSKAYCAWEKQARLVAILLLRGTLEAPFGGPIKNVKVTAYYKGQQPDLSGVLESVADCLEKIIWTDDKNIIAWDGSRLYHDLKNPRTEVEVEI
jgi:Holliday junction resolvase RusA-like endonuclease